jgi:hypothetical protein
LPVPGEWNGKPEGVILWLVELQSIVALLSVRRGGYVLAKLLYWIRWWIAERLLILAFKSAPPGVEKHDLMTTMIPWFNRQIVRLKTELARRERGI